jgi:RNA polymerase-binding transcription factor DksA
VNQVTETSDEQPAVDTPSADGPEPDRRAPDGPAPAPPSQATAADEVDLDAVERDLSAVEMALNRLAEGTYWTDEVTGQPIPEHVLVRDPLARRA